MEEKELIVMEATAQGLKKGKRNCGIINAVFVSQATEGQSQILCKPLLGCE
ncbi:MAG: hypothetical protein ACLVHV_06060 [Oscillospiraceae bacterium]